MKGNKRITVTDKFPALDLMKEADKDLQEWLDYEEAENRELIEHEVKTQIEVFKPYIDRFLDLFERKVQAEEEISKELHSIVTGKKFSV